MLAYRQIIRNDDDEPLLAQARWCNSFGSKLRGFTFRRELAVDEALVLVDRRDSRVNSAIHMLFVFCPLAVFWVNDAGRVVDKVLAQPWRLAYTPQAPARYVIEGHPRLLNQIEVGDAIRFGRRS